MAKATTSVSDSKSPNMMDVHTPNPWTNAHEFIFDESQNAFVLTVPASSFKLDEYNGNYSAKCLIWTGDKYAQTLGKLDVSGVKSEKGNGIALSFRISDPVKAVAAGIRPADKPKGEIIPQHIAEITGPLDDIDEVSI